MAELCITGDAAAFCHDERLPDGQKDYTRPYPGASPAPGALINYIATNPDDFNARLDWEKRHCK